MITIRKAGGSEGSFLNGPTVPLRVLQVIKERVLNVKPDRESSGLVTWSGGAARAAILRDALVVDAHVSLMLNTLGIRLAGLSNYAICVKSA